MTFLIEGYWPPSAGQPDPERLARAAEASGHGDVHYRGAVTVPSDSTVFWLFDAPSIEALRAAAAAAGLTADRIVEATAQDLGGRGVHDALTVPNLAGRSGDAVNEGRSS